MRRVARGKRCGRCSLCSWPLRCAGLGTGNEPAITVTLPPQGGEAVSPSAAQVSASSPVSPGLDPVLALRAQRHNLLLLFERYGENNQSLNMSGFRQLLRSLGEERLKSIAIQRTDHHHHHHDHHRHPHHNHHHHHPHPVSPNTEHSHTTCEENRKKRHVSSSESQAPGTGSSSISLGTEVECLNASRLLTLHGMNMQMLLDLDEFRYICPAIINQIDRKSCLINDHDDAMAESSQGVYSVKVAWIGGFISITVISVLSLLGIILVPLMNKVFFKFLLSFLVALAVGTLSGDAFLHLLPH
ncbi:PREDICTED: zinc transporter ZIP6-like, partial [Nanorana parkeri]|uniref:zinc transporter ZIP6-like n=1 Tax=Nanorana parkeri TaxID=125878 RepID=UPI0008541BDA